MHISIHLTKFPQTISLAPAISAVHLSAIYTVHLASFQIRCTLVAVVRPSHVDAHFGCSFSLWATAGSIVKSHAWLTKLYILFGMLRD